MNGTQPRFTWSRAALAGALLLASISSALPANAARYYGVTNFPIHGGQMVPPTPSGASGVGTVLIDTELNELQFDISLTGIVGEIEAHFHGFAGPSANAPVIFELPTGDHKIGVWNYAEEEEPGILAGLTYAVIHTFAYGTGEIRGQVVPAVVAVDDPVTEFTLQLSLPSPNPSHGDTEIGFSLPRRARAHVCVVDVHGRRVADLIRGELGPGMHVVRWNGRDDSGRLASGGPYWVILEADGSRAVRKLILVR